MCIFSKRLFTRMHLMSPRSRDGGRDVGREAQTGLHHRADAVLLRRRPGVVLWQLRLFELLQVKKKQKKNTRSFSATHRACTADDGGYVRARNTLPDLQRFVCIHKTQMKSPEAVLREGSKNSHAMKVKLSHQCGPPSWHARVWLCRCVCTYAILRPPRAG